VGVLGAGRGRVEERRGSTGRGAVEDVELGRDERVGHTPLCTGGRLGWLGHKNPVDTGGGVRQGPSASGWRYGGAKCQCALSSGW